MSQPVEARQSAGLRPLPAHLDCDPIQARRAIEALRAGVPNRDAVRLLSTQQPQAEERFRRQLGALARDAAAERPTSGLLLAGDFGAGKSHLLEFLEHRGVEIARDGEGGCQTREPANLQFPSPPRKLGVGAGALLE